MPLSIATAWTEILRSTRTIKGIGILTVILKQVVKVFWHKAASPPQTDSSVVFDRWRQCALPWGHIGATWRIRLNLCFIGPPDSTAQTINWSVQPFLHRSPHSVPIFYNGYFSPSKLPLLIGESGPPSNTWFLGPTQVLKPSGISIGSAVFAGLTAVTDKPTDHMMLIVRIHCTCVLAAQLC